MNKKKWKGFGTEPLDNRLVFSKKVTKRNNEYSVFKLPTMMTTNHFELAAMTPGSTVISEKDYEPMECCLCGADMPTVHHTHNPSPLTPNTTAKMAMEDMLPHRCCSKCNKKIVSYVRLGNEDYYQEKTKFYNKLFKREGVK